MSSWVRLVNFIISSIVRQHVTRIIFVILDSRIIFIVTANKLLLISLNSLCRKPPSTSYLNSSYYVLICSNKLTMEIKARSPESNDSTKLELNLGVSIPFTTVSLSLSCLLLFSPFLFSSLLIFYSFLLSFFSPVNFLSPYFILLSLHL